ncbi:hypothetical protein [Methylophaga pinxianii]|nr:hypothetical protein [Methylophaga pinxianii]
MSDSAKQVQPEDAAFIGHQLGAEVLPAVSEQGAQRTKLEH